MTRKRKFNDFTSHREMYGFYLWPSCRSSLPSVGCYRGMTIEIIIGSWNSRMRDVGPTTCPYKSILEV